VIANVCDAPGAKDDPLADATPVVVAEPMIDEINTPPHGALEPAVTTTPGVTAPSAMLPAVQLKVTPPITTLASPKGTLALGEMTNP
jgi:hypothetical protein